MRIHKLTRSTPLQTVIDLNQIQPTWKTGSYKLRLVYQGMPSERVGLSVWPGEFPVKPFVATIAGDE